MAIIDITKVKAASFLHGFAKRSRVTGVVNVASFTFFSGERRNFEAVLPIPSIDAASITLVKFNGVGNSNVNGKWILLPGQNFFRNSTPSYDVETLVTRESDGLHLKIQFVNNTVASNQTVPDITMDYKTIFFDAPW